MKIKRNNPYRWNGSIAGCLGGSSKSSTSDTTQTTSGSGVSISGGGTNAGPGSIAVGQGGQYREAGSIDLSGLKNTGTGSTTVNIVPQAALDALKNLADGFSSTVKSIAGGGGGTVALSGPASTSTNYTKWILGGLLALAGLLGLRALLSKKS